jgi:hypothetical protein
MELYELKRLTIDMVEAFGLDRRIEAYSGKRSIGLYRWDVDCLLAEMDNALKDQRAYPDKISSSYASLQRLQARLKDEYRRVWGGKGFVRNSDDAALWVRHSDAPQIFNT